MMSIGYSRPTITRKDLENVLDCILGENLEAGQMVKAFESQLAGITGFKYALSTNSATSAFHLAQLALDIGQTDEIIIPSYFPSAPFNASGLIGAKPVFIDVDEKSLFPSVENIKSKIGDKTKALIIGHILGFPFPIRDLQEISVPIIEDISHIFYSEKIMSGPGRSNTIGIASFSPYMLITTGNGGMVFTNNSKLFSYMREKRGSCNNGPANSLDYTMTDFQAAMGMAQIMKLKDMIKRRQEIARVYFGAIKKTPHETPYVYSDDFSYPSFPIIFQMNAEKTDKYWKKKGIEIRNPIPRTLHTLAGYDSLDCPNSERLSKKLYSLPIYPTLSKKEIEKIANCLAKFI